MTDRVILSIVAIIMLALTLKRGDKLSILLTLGLTVGILITWTGISAIRTIGLVIYMLSALMIAFNGSKRNGLTKLSQYAIILTGLWAFGANLFAIMNWPYFTLIRLSMIIPIAFYTIGLVSGMIKRKEFGYLTIINVGFILRLI